MIDATPISATAMISSPTTFKYKDREGKTALIVACLNPALYDVAKTLIEWGANVNAYRPGRNGGTPLHHAAKRGLDNVAVLLFSHGANALLINDDCQTPLDIARAKGYTHVVRAIEVGGCCSMWSSQPQKTFQVRACHLYKYTGASPPKPK